MSQVIEQLEATQVKADLPAVNVGDTIDVHVKIVEGGKERVQVFSGVVLKMQGSGLTRTMTVRRIVANEGVERTFPIHSPRVVQVDIKRQGHTRRSKLYYLRERVGKSRRLRDRRRGLGQFLPDETPQQKAGEAAAQAKAADKTEAQTTEEAAQ